MIQIDHIGIAVDDINKIKDIFNKILGINFRAQEDISGSSVKVLFSEETPSIELIQATSDKSPIYPILDHPIKSFIKKKGVGLHHISFKVDNIEQAIKELKLKGINVLNDNILEGYQNKKVIFIDPNQTEGILIELNE